MEEAKKELLINVPPGIPGVTTPVEPPVMPVLPAPTTPAPPREFIDGALYFVRCAGVATWEVAEYSAGNSHWFMVGETYSVPQTAFAEIGELVPLPKPVYLEGFYWVRRFGSLEWEIARCSENGFFFLTGSMALRSASELDAIGARLDSPMQP
jgi:hypothetical protein